MLASLAACGAAPASSAAADAFDTAQDIAVFTREDGSGTRGAFIELTGLLEKDADGNKTDKTTDDADDDTSAAKKGFKDSLEHAKGLLASVKQQYGSSEAGKRISEGLQSAIDAAEKLDLSPITNSKIYKAAKVTLDEAIATVSNWIDSQAAKAQ